MSRKPNNSQELAINFKDGACLVLSGPGSGKTFVLINRVLTLITKYKVNPSSILVITFTKAAATEMEERFNLIASESRLVGNENPNFGTFHSIFFDILREGFDYKYNSAIKKSDANKLLIYIVNDRMKLNLSKETVNSILKDISLYKLSKESGKEFTSRFLNQKTFIKVYNDFNQLMFDERKLGFSDMISMCHKLLLENKEVLKYYQKKYKYILIDEFQDINRSQYEIVKLICKNKNIFVVGDDDQSIYAFRGSSPGIMKEFLKDYHKAKVINLNTNYRSVDNIVGHSRKVIENNVDRFEKDLVAHNKDIGKFTIKGFIDSRDENKYIIDCIRKYKKLGISLSDIAILYRTNVLPYAIISDLNKVKIPFSIKDKKNLNIDYATYANSPKISLMTFHMAKGLEFKVVFIIDANDGIVPHKKSIRDCDIETERRLFYVAMTRAKTDLHILFTVRRFGKNFKASRFILEAIGGKYEQKR